MKRDYLKWQLFIAVQLIISIAMSQIGIHWLTNYFLAGYAIGNVWEDVYKKTFSRK